MLQYGILDSRNIFCSNPILGSGSQKGLIGFVAWFLDRLILSKTGINMRQSNDQIRIISTDPSLRVHSIDVECLAGIAGQMFVVLFEDFVEAHEIDIDEFFQSQKVIGDFFGLIHETRSVRGKRIAWVASS